MLENDQHHKAKQNSRRVLVMVCSWLGWTSTYSLGGVSLRSRMGGGASGGGDVVFAPWCSGWGEMGRGITAAVPAVVNTDTERREEEFLRASPHNLPSGV